MRLSGFKFIVLAATIGISACTSKTANQSIARAAQEKPRALMVRVAKQVHACWFKKKDPALRGYKMASEVNSYSGKPRILIVPRNNPTGLPKLVAQAERRGGRNQFTSFGPLLKSKNGPRLAASLDAWARGNKSC